MFSSLFYRFFVLTACFGGLQGCQFSKVRRGYAPHDSIVQGFLPGKTTKNDVIEAIGSPALVLFSNSDIWVYSKVVIRGKTLQPLELEDVYTYVLRFKGDVFQGLEKGKNPFHVSFVKPSKGPRHVKNSFFIQLLPSKDFLKNYSKTEVSPLEPHYKDS